MLKRTTALANTLAAALKTDLDAGFLFLYAGTVPATADEALDLVAVHTEVLKVSNNGGVTGLTFEAPANGVLAKEETEVWKGTVTFDGFDDAETTLTPTFYRFCPAGDNGRGVANASTGYRIQGTVGGPSSGADLVLGTTTVTAGNEQPVGAFAYRF